MTGPIAADPARDVDHDVPGALLLGQPWRLSWRADPRARPLADRHYNRQRIGAAQFVPPGRCLVLPEDWPEQLPARPRYAGGQGDLLAELGSAS